MKPITSLIAAVTACVLLASHSGAAPVTFTIDSSQSFLSLALSNPGTGVFTSPQTAGSDTTSLSGTVGVDLTATTIQFLATANTQFALQPLPQSPLPFGDPGTAPAQFGLTAFIQDLLTGRIAGRDFVGDATSDPISLSGGVFDASQITLSTPVENIDYSITFGDTLAAGRITDSFPALNTLTAGTLEVSGGIATLTVPLLVIGFIDFQGLEIDPIYSGQIVATAVIPEPATLVMLSLGLVGLLICRSAKR